MFITLEMIRILFGRVGLSNLIQTTKMVELINQKLLNLIGGVMLTWETFHSRGRQQSIFQVGLDYYLQ